MVVECPDCGTQIKTVDNTCIPCPNCGFHGCDEWIPVEEE